MFGKLKSCLLGKKEKAKNLVLKNNVLFSYSMQIFENGKAPSSFVIEFISYV